MKKTSINTVTILGVIAISVTLFSIAAQATEMDERIEASANKSYVSQDLSQGRFH